MSTNPDLAQAREWTKLAVAHETSEVSRAAARIIQSLPDEWIDAAKLRELLDKWAANPFPTSDEVAVLNDVEALLPAPAPRTLADMTPEEREACQWMQADFSDSSTGRTIRVVITRVSPTTADIILLGGIISCAYHGRLTPLPDLPRMVWPDEQAAEEDMSIIPPKIDISRPHVDDVDMKPEDVPEGELWLVEFDGQQGAAERELPGTEYPWWLMFGWRVSDSDITLVSRLVPEEKA